MALLAASIAGNQDVVQSLLKKGTHVNEPDARGRTPLSWAAQYGQEEIVRLLLERSELEPNFLDHSLRGPLSWAAQYGQDTIVKLILKRFANDGILSESDTRDKEGRTPLSYSAGVHGNDDTCWRYMPGRFPFPFQYQDMAVWTNRNLPQPREPERLAIAKLLIHANADPQSTDMDGQTPLHWASLEGQERLVSLYLKEKVNPNHAKDAAAVLGPVMIHDHDTAANDLLFDMIDIDPNTKDKSGRTPLFLAVENQQRAIVQKLLSHPEIDPNVKDNSGLTPLLAAIEVMDTSETKNLLRRHGIYVRHTEEGRIQELILIEKEQVEIMKLLLNRDEVDPNFQHPSGQTPLSRAARSGNEHLVDALLENTRVYPDPKDNSGRTPLFLAAESGYNSVVKLFLNPDKNRGHIIIDSRDNSGWTPLSSAAYNGHLKAVELLLSPGGAKPDTPADDGRTPLSLAAQRGHEQIVRLLTRHGADPNFRDKYGRTSVDWAIERFTGAMDDHMTPKTAKFIQSIYSIVSYLLKRGAQPDSKDNENRTPLQRAIDKGIEKVALLLLSKTNFHNLTPLSWAAENGDEAFMKFLLKQDDTKVDSEDRDGRTALWRAANTHNESLVKLLASKDNVTLTILLEDDQKVAVRWMLDAGCEVNTTDPLGRTPLHVAVLNRQHGLLQEIIEAGADINAKDSDGKTPIHLAIEEPDTEMIRILLEFSAQTKSIMADQWSQAYMKVDPKADHAHTIHLTHGESGANIPRFFSKGDDPEKPEVGNVQLRQVFILTSLSPWTSGWIPNIEWNWPYGPTVTFGAHKSNHLSPGTEIYSPSRPVIKIETKKDNPRCTIFTLVALTPTNVPTKNDKFLESQVFETLAITWTMAPLRGSQNNRSWISVDHFSMLKNGWIPKDNMEFVTQFVSKLCQDWLSLCDRAEKHVRRRRSAQLEKKGLSPKLINHLAEDALAWAELRNMLRYQVHVLETFAKEHGHRYGSMRGLENMQKAINQFSEDVEARLNALDQTVRDLLQLEFSWVSIVEAHKSTSLSMSMKRLSWITFIFLPPMFAASLFGMNVDVLASNPDWRWYPLFCIGFLLATLAGWLTFRSVEPRAEQRLIRIGAEFNKRFRKGGTRAESASDIEMNSTK